MLYRIDIQHFLSHAIDYFTRNELAHCQYVIISAKIANTATCENVVKRNNIYPTNEIVETYAAYENKAVLEKMYMDLLKIEGPKDNWLANVIYSTFVNPVINHQDVVIVCDKVENDYIDVLCKYLRRDFALECIDLNKLFTEGKVDGIYLDRNKIWDKAVDIRRASGVEMNKALSSTRDGRLGLLAKMTKKDKVGKLKELGIEVTKRDMGDLDKILMDAWVNDD